MFLQGMVLVMLVLKLNKSFLLCSPPVF